MIPISEKIFIPGSVPSLKNSKVKTSSGIFPSRTVAKYLQSLGIRAYSTRDRYVKEYKTRPNLFREALRSFPELNGQYPVIITFYFIRRTKAAFDFNNANQIILDLLSAHRFIEDDNMNFILPFPVQYDGKWYEVCKEKPGVIIQVFKC